MLKLAAYFFFFLLTLVTKAQSFSIYQTLNTGHGLPSNYVFAVTEDEAGFFWAGTDKGLCRYDGFRWTVWDRDNGLPGNYINMVLSDKKGGLWLGISEKGYYHFNPQNGKLRPLDHPEYLLPYTLQTDSEGALYAEAGQGDVYTGYRFRPEAIAKPEIVFQYRGKQSVILRGDAGKERVYGLLTKQADSTALKKALHTKWPVHLRKVTEPFPEIKTVYYLSDSVVVTNTAYFRFGRSGEVQQQANLFANGNSYAYACATGQGLFVYDIKTGYYHFNATRPPAFYNHSSGLETDYVNHIYEAKDGTIVIATLGAGLKLVKNRYRKTFFLDHQPVRSILPLGNDWLLLAGETVYKTSGSGQSLAAVATAGPTAFSLWQNKDTVLVATLKGVAFYASKGAALEPLRFLECTAGISSVINTTGGYLAGTYGSGLVQFRYGTVLQKHLGYPFRIVEKIVPLQQGFAALSHEDGVILTNTATSQNSHLTQKQGLLSNSVFSLYQRGDTVWIGTRGGVALYTASRVVQTLRFPPSYAQEKALAVFFDRAHRLWTVSNRCLYLQTGGALLPVASFPLVEKDDAVTAAAYNPHRNEVAIGSGKTFSIVRLDAVVANQRVTKPALLKTVLDGKEGADLPGGIPYHFNTLKFVLAPFFNTLFAQHELYYQLQGLHNDWKPLKDSLAVSFTGLRPGNYTLLVKPVNADGYGSGPEVLARFTVQKPFWQTAPFILLLIGITVVVTWLVSKAVEKANRRKKEAALLLQQTLHRERERIAKDLHDHLGANLATIIAQTDNIETRLYRGDWQTASQTVQHLSAQTRETMNVLRETIWAVQETAHSLSEFLLRIRTFLQRHYEGTSISWEVKETAVEPRLLSPAQTLHLFRLVQEASQNILKHSGAQKATYTFTLQEHTLHVQIADNGRGFLLPDRATNGLANMSERVKLLNGTFTLTAAPSVCIEVVLPL
ncbi:hypothetical protein HRG84_02695 [Flavisolibacter sp. BT320]|nr:hypothetical protein [Flavisolibacter longurius]